jgi:DDE family transposase
MGSALDESWELLLSLFPSGWEQQAVLSGAVERLREFASVDQLLRILLLHVGKGYSLRETAVRAKQAGLADVSDVTVLNRLRAAESWWHWLCTALLAERGWYLSADSRGYNVRALDGTLVKEPGRTGGLWRIHYSLRIPSLECDHLEVTAVRGGGTGEKLERFPAAPGDLILADRGFCKPGGVSRLHQQGAAVIVRLNTATLPLYRANGSKFALLGHVRQVQQVGLIRQWKVWVQTAEGGIPGRVCVLRKSEQAARKAQRHIVRKAQQGGPEPKPETLEYAHYVIVFTTLEAELFPAPDILEWYRVRWQIELVFKKLKTLAHLGHLPKRDERSSRAWLYGKLLVALLSQKLLRLGRDISPWGYSFAEVQSQLWVATV